MSTALRLEKATLAHLPVLARVHAQCFEDPWSSQSIAEILASPGAFACIAVISQTAAAAAADNPVGLALARVAADEAELLTLCVLPQSRRHGFGARLLDDVMQQARAAGALRIFLEVAENNEVARALYGRIGFSAVGRRPDYYCLPNRVPVAALTLRRDLTAGLHAQFAAHGSAGDA
jgi:ribosomal-protein-alanine N-acetyltransferase